MNRFGMEVETINLNRSHIAHADYSMARGALSKHGKAGIVAISSYRNQAAKAISRILQRLNEGGVAELTAHNTALTHLLKDAPILVLFESCFRLPSSYLPYISSLFLKHILLGFRSYKYFHYVFNKSALVSKQPVQYK